MKTLTVFTPTYNRKHTLWRTYESLCRQTCKDFDWLIIDDGSTDGTREWVLSLGTCTPSKDQNRFDWMGRVVEANTNNTDRRDFFCEHELPEIEHELSINNCSDIEEDVSSVKCQTDAFCVDVDLPDGEQLHISYIYKENGGLYTGYNVAYQTIGTELCVCIDSDDYMPDDAVEKIVNRWSSLSEIEKRKYCGIVGLDFDVRTKEPIGGYFKEEDCFYYCMKHNGDTKEVMRTELMKREAPMIGFEGEKNFNPFYMFMHVIDNYPILFLNVNLCWVEYQIGKDSMSQGIWKQYINSPRSYTKFRLRALESKHNSFIDKMRLLTHYISSCIISRDRGVLNNSPHKILTILALPLGWLLYLYVRYKNINS